MILIKNRRLRFALFTLSFLTISLFLLNDGLSIGVQTTKGKEWFKVHVATEEGFYINIDTRSIHRKNNCVYADGSFHALSNDTSSWNNVKLAFTSNTLLSSGFVHYDSTNLTGSDFTHLDQYSYGNRTFNHVYYHNFPVIPNDTYRDFDVGICFNSKPEFAVLAFGTGSTAVEIKEGTTNYMFNGYYNVSMLEANGLINAMWVLEDNADWVAGYYWFKSANMATWHWDSDKTGFACYITIDARPVLVQYECNKTNEGSHYYTLYQDDWWDFMGDEAFWSDGGIYFYQWDLRVAGGRDGTDYYRISGNDTNASALGEYLTGSFGSAGNYFAMWDNNSGYTYGLAVNIWRNKSTSDDKKFKWKDKSTYAWTSFGNNNEYIWANTSTFLRCKLGSNADTFGMAERTHTVFTDMPSITNDSATGSGCGNSTILDYHLRSGDFIACNNTNNVLNVSVTPNANVTNVYYVIEDFAAATTSEIFIYNSSTSYPTATPDLCIHLVNSTGSWNYTTNSTCLSPANNYTQIYDDVYNNTAIKDDGTNLDIWFIMEHSSPMYITVQNKSIPAAAPPVTYYPEWFTNQSSTPYEYSNTTFSEFNVTWNISSGDINMSLIEGNWSGSAANYTMSNTTYQGDIYNFSAILPAGSFYWKSYANSSSGEWNTTDTWYFTILNGTTTHYINWNLNVSTIDTEEAMLAYARWYVDSSNYNLSHYIFSTNNSGSWVNASATAFSSTNNSWSNVTTEINKSREGQAVGFRIFANSTETDTANYTIWNLTSIRTVTVNNEVPVIASLSYTPDCIENNQSITVSWSQSDNNQISSSHCFFRKLSNNYTETGGTGSTSECQFVLNETGGWFIDVIIRDPAGNSDMDTFYVEVKSIGKCGSEEAAGTGGGGDGVERRVKIPACPEGEYYDTELEMCLPLLPEPKAPAQALDELLLTPRESLYGLSYIQIGSVGGVMMVAASYTMKKRKYKVRKKRRR